MTTEQLAQVLRNQLDVVVDSATDMKNNGALDLDDFAHLVTGDELYPESFIGATATEVKKVERVQVEAYMFDMTDSEGNTFQVTVDRINWK